MGLFCSSGLSILLAQNSGTWWYKFTEMVLGNAINDDSCCSCCAQGELYPRIMSISRCISEVHALHTWGWVRTRSSPPFTAWKHRGELIRAPKLTVHIFGLRIPVRHSRDPIPWHSHGPGNGTAAITRPGQEIYSASAAAHEQSTHLCPCFLCYLSNRSWTEITGLLQSSHWKAACLLKPYSLWNASLSMEWHGHYIISWWFMIVR